MKKNQEINAYEIKTTPKTTRSMKSFQKKYEPEKIFVMNQERIEKTDSEIFLPLIFS